MAVKVTLVPETEGFADDVTTALVPSWLTVCVRAAWLVMKLVLPL